MELDEGEEERGDTGGDYYFAENISSPFVILSQNIRSFNANYRDFRNYLQRIKNCKILAFQEIWKLDNSVSIPGFQTILHKNRKLKGGGGCAIAIADGIQYKEIDAIFLEDQFESIGVEFQYKNKKFSLFNVYHPPKRLDISQLLDSISVLKSRADPKSKIIILGDFNIDVLDSKNADFVSRMIEWSLPPMFTCATRIVGSSATALDLIFTNETTLFGGPVESSVSDHYLTFAAFVGKKAQRKVTCKPDHSQKALQNLREWLQKVDFTGVLNDKEITAFDKFDRIMKSACDACCPMKRSIIKHKYQAPWFTSGFLTSHRHKDKLKHKARKKNTKVAWEKFKKYNSLYFKLCRVARLRYFNTEFQINKNDSRAMWRLANNVTGREKKQSGITNFPGCRNEKEISQVFNTYYSNIASEIISKIPCSKKSYDQYLPAEKPKSKLTFQPIFPTDIVKILDSMKNKSSYGPDRISNKVLKVIKEEIKLPLCHLVNLSFLHNFVPESWKISRICPIHKGGDRNLTTNFRPISLCITYSKLLEKCAIKQMNLYLDKNNILYDKQFAYRKGYRCESLLLKFQDIVFRARNSGKHCVSVFLDLSKAFDLVNHKKLLDKLEFWGLPRAWFASYLSKRKQYTSIGDANSETSDVEHGVPQGSCLGPILFTLFLLCLPHNIDMEVLMFADDTTLMAVGDDIDELFIRVNKQLQIVEDYFSSNSLVLQPKKTRMMFFSNSHQCPDLYLCGDKIVRIGEEYKETSFKFLGILMDERLSYRYHIDWVFKKVQASLALLVRSKKTLNYKMKLLLYNSLIMSHVNYGSCIWGGASDSLLDKLAIPQKKAIRAVCSAKYNQHSTPLFHKCGALKISDFIELNYLKLGNSLYHGLQPKPVLELFNFFTNDRTRSGANFQLKEPSCKTDRLRTATSYFLPKTWNNAVKDYRFSLETKTHALTKNFKNIKLTEYKSYKCYKSKCYVC